MVAFLFVPSKLGIFRYSLCFVLSSLVLSSLSISLSGLVLFSSFNGQVPVVCITLFLILKKLTCFLLVMCVSSLLQLPCPAQRFTCSFNYNVPVPANFCFASVFTLVPSRFSNICRYSSSILLLET